MTKKTKPSLDELKRTEEQKELDAETKLVAEKVEAILKESSFGLQTFIEPTTEAGVITGFRSRARLVKVVKNEGQKTS